VLRGALAGTLPLSPPSCPNPGAYPHQAPYELQAFPWSGPCALCLRLRLGAY
jgi:hypothetical protein